MTTTAVTTSTTTMTTAGAINGGATATATPTATVTSGSANCQQKVPKDILLSLQNDERKTRLV